MDVREQGMDSCLQKTLDEIQRATEGMSAEQLAWHPPGKWSAGDILEHLTLTFSGTVKGMQRMLASTGAGVQKRTLKDRLSALIVVEIGYFPSGRKAPEMVVPQGTDASRAVETIVSNLKEMDAVLSEVERKKGRSARVPHPVIGPLTIEQWRKFHLTHTKHHMKQIAKLRQSNPQSVTRKP